MSGRHKRDRKPEQHQGLWVNTEARADGGGYYVTVTWEQDRIWRLTPDQVDHYVSTCYLAGQYAEFDAAVIKQLTTIGIPLEDAGMVVASELRQDRVPVPDAAPGLRYEPGVTAAGKPFVKAVVDGQEQATIDLPQFRAHLQHLVEAPIAADLDSRYRAMLISAIGLDPVRASNIVSDLANHRWKS